MQSLGTKKPGTPGFLLVIRKDHSVTSSTNGKKIFCRLPYRHSVVVTQHAGGPKLSLRDEMPRNPGI